MKHVEDPQNELPLNRRGADVQIDIPLEQIAALRGPGDALDLAIRAAMLERKEVYLALGIDPGTFSKILDNKAAFPGERIKEFCDLVNNRIYVQWINSQVGCTAVLLKSEAERIAEQALARAATAEREVEILHGVIRTISGGPAK